MWDFPLFPERASSLAGRVDFATLSVTGVTVFFTLLVLFLVVFFSIRYYRGHRVDRSDPPEAIAWLEALWIGVPLVLSLYLFAVGTEVYYELYSPPGDASTIYVIGKQWMWKLQHPEGKKEINELHIPVGRPVKLVMTSQDVIHSFFVPAFRIKQDVLPGRYTEEWFQPTRVGKYHLFCTEYCGTDHSVMGGWVYVMEPADYADWLRGRPSGGTGGMVGTANMSMAEQGEKLFVQHHCAGCHGPAQVVRAPRLEGVFGRPVPIYEKDPKDVHFVQADERYIRDSILLPKTQVVAGYEPLMPSFKDVIPEEDLLKIIEYIKSIGPETSEVAAR